MKRAKWSKRKDLFVNATNGHMVALVVAAIIALM